MKVNTSVTLINPENFKERVMALASANAEYEDINKKSYKS
jgi:hypothetical protein